MSSNLQSHFNPPPRDLIMQAVAWLDQEVYPGLLGQQGLDNEGRVAWIDDRYVSLWQTMGPHDQPLVKHEAIKHQLFREIKAVHDRQRRHINPPVLPKVGDRVWRPFNGPLRRASQLLHDDTGYRWAFFCSWFPALRILRDNPAEFYRQLDVIATYYQGFRAFLFVGGWTDFWDGREVVPPMLRFRKWHWTGNHGRSDRYGNWVEGWPDYEQLLRTMLRACRERGLRLHLTTGDIQIICTNDRQEFDPAKELHFHDWVSRICADEGGPEVVALLETTNEVPINRPGGNTDYAYAQMGRILDLWRRNCPGPLLAQGAARSEEPKELLDSGQHGDVTTVHVVRSPFSMCLKRTFGIINWEGDWRHLADIVWQGEPAGPGKDSYAAVNDPKKLTALYGMHKLLGTPSNFFNGPAVRSLEPLESTWGFRELPVLLERVLPEDVALWDRAANTSAQGILYWTRGDQFCTSSLSSSSDPAASWNPAPPRPIAEWTLYAGDEEHRGTGTPPPFTGVLTGTFAD